MPILSPPIQRSLLKLTILNEKSNKNRFYLRYLKIASRNLYRNLDTISAAIQFKEDLKQNTSLFFRRFGCKINDSDMKNPTVNDFYKYLYNKIGNEMNINNKKSENLEGKYFKIAFSNNYDNCFENYFFIPTTFYSKRHSWFFTDTPITILAIKLNDKIKSDFIQLIKLEIDLMKAAGFTLVLCAVYNKNTDFIFDLIQSNQFSEIHLNCIDDPNINFFLQEMNTKKYTLFESFKGFLYIYSPYINKKSEYRGIYKEIKKIPRVKFLNFTDSVIAFHEISPFSYCKTGFKFKHLRIELSNVPLYDDNVSFVPHESSGISYCYISPDDFMNWKKDRVRIIFNDEINNKCTVKYVNFEDIHSIRKGFYIIDPLSAGKIKSENLKQIDKLESQINEKIEKRKKKKFKKDNIRSFSTEKLINNSINYATYAYAYCENSLDNDFSIHRPQIYTAFKASKKFINKKNINLNKLKNDKKKIDNELYHHIEKFFNVMDLYFEKRFCNKEQSAEKLKLLHHEFKFLSRNPEIVIQNIFSPNNQDKENYLNEKVKKLYEKRKQIEEQIQNYTGKCHKGVVYQIDTGEGKSCIICLIAAILALNGKTVHISSSNIKLANRDYMDSYDFFRTLKLKTAVLLHDNELPIPPRKKDKSKRQKNDTNKPILTNKPETSNEANDDVYDAQEAEETLFKDNFENYYRTNTQNDKTEYSKYYHNDNDYFDEKQFKNSSRMNFAVCGLDLNNKIPKNKPNIVFSTFVNFECFYLKLLEISPGYIDEYYENCALLIDEADSILIDEIANGTVVSRDIKSNSKEVLQFVYDQCTEKVSPEDTYTEIMGKWPKCVDLTLNDVKKMYSEIKLINQEEFKNGKKYSIEEFEVKNDKKKKDLINNTLNLVKSVSVKVAKGLMKELSNENKESEDNEEEDDDDDSDDGDDDEEEEINDDNDEENNSPVTKFKHIVPFDYDHKGILEPNKEFGGFIQQFIAIKESKIHKNMIIKDISMNYLYVSHPIFVKLYSNVCGFTGTIGTKEEKQIYKDQYNLKTVRIPRNKVNQAIELPMILCDSITDRNKTIVFEILQFHKQGNPVLVIFADLKEIDEVAKMIHFEGIRYVNVFDGKDDIIRPDIIAGLNGAISLGTNVCGRGTNIKSQDKPLHVIISYYSSNTRIMNQAHGRTGRQGQKGTSRVICLKEQFLNPKTIYNNGITTIIDEFSIKNEAQKDYIVSFQMIKPWLFSNDIDIQEIDSKYIMEMRNARINVNRIVAYNFEYPLKMSIDTFLKIQSQKIFSIFNCPNSKFTWRLFQKYVREMIFQSWSLMVNKVDEEFFDRKENEEYKNELEKLKDLNLDIRSPEYQQKRRELNQKFSKNMKEYKKELNINKIKLLMTISEYLPEEKNDIVPTFMNIFNKVVNLYEKDILNSFNSISNVYSQSKTISFFSCQIGFKPYSLLTESGARVSYKNFKKTNYIKDPELKYMKLTPKHHFCLLSITEKIDDLFNLIFQKINEILGNKTFLKLFMRRTLCGCEFGVCLSFPFNNECIENPNCIIDKDPLLLFTISVKSIIPVLAGILIILLVYVASMAKEIGKWFTSLPAKFTKEFALKAVGVIINIVSPELTNFGLDKVIQLLSQTLKKQIKKLREFNTEKAEKAANIIDDIKSIFNSKAAEKVNKKFSNFLGEKIKVTVNWKKLIKNCFDPERIMKISFYVLLCLGTFLLNFNLRKNSIQQETKNTEIYENSFKTNKQEKKEKRDKIKIKNAIKSISKKEQEKLRENGELLIETCDTNVFLEEEDDDEKEENKKEKKPDKKVLKKKDTEMKNKIRAKTVEVLKTYLYQFNAFNPIKIIKKFSDFNENNKFELLSNGIANISAVIQKGALKKQYLRMRYNSVIKKAFIQQIRIYATNQFPSIVKLIGYTIHKNNYDLLIEPNHNISLASIIAKKSLKFNETNILIIAYGIASALKFLHSHKIVHRNINPSNILLDSSLYPYLSEFYYAKQIQTKYNFILVDSTPGFMPPEFIKDCRSNQDSFALDSYAYGMTLFILVTGNNPFDDLTKDQILSITKDGFRPAFPSVNSDWINLISRCLSRNPNERPSFSEICDILESNEFAKGSINAKSFNKYKKIFQNIE